jgi:deoxyhypusine synthase
VQEVSLAKRKRGSSRIISPPPLAAGETAASMIEKSFLAYNSRRLQDAGRLFVEKIARPKTRVTLAISGALTPAGLGASCIVPLMERGWVDWIVSTGANLYHDLHVTLGFPPEKGPRDADDARLLEEGKVRIYDILLPMEALLETDRFVREAASAALEEGTLQGPCSSADVHRMLGEALIAKDPGSVGRSILAAAAQWDIPVYAGAPGDSSIGMNLAALELSGSGAGLDIARDVNETASFVYDIKRTGGKSAVVILGGGTSKNFALQTEPHIQEVLGLDEKGHDFFIQFTDARADTGGLSGATPSEAVTWGKVDPDRLPDAVVCYGDCTILVPLWTSYVLERGRGRKPGRLWKRRNACVKRLRDDYLSQA